MPAPFLGKGLGCQIATSHWPLLCSPNCPFPSSHSFSISEGCVFMITLAFLGRHPYTGFLSSDLLGFWWDNSFSDIIAFKKYPKKWMKEALSFSAMQGTAEIASKLHLLMENTAGNWISYVLNWVVSFFTWYSENSISQSTDVTRKERKRKKRFYDQISLGNAGLNKIGELSFLYDFLDPLIC